MSFVPAICTQCGATIKVDNTKDAAICEHCGTPFVVEKAINNYTINNTIKADTVIVQAEEKVFDLVGGILYKYLGNESEVVLPDSVYEIAECAFANAYIKSIVFDSNLRIIRDEAFANCKELRNITFAECNVRELGSKAFLDCAKLESFDFSAIESIGDQAFANTGIREVKLPQHRVCIKGQCFCGCSNLEYADIYSCVFDINPMDTDARLALFDDDPKLLEIHSELCDELVDIMKKNGSVFLNERDEIYCDKILGNCGFSKFFCKGNKDTNIRGKHSECIFCGGSMKNVRDGLFKSHQECEKCRRPIPTYDEFLTWTRNSVFAEKSY